MRFILLTLFFVSCFSAQQNVVNSIDDSPNNIDEDPINVESTISWNENQLLNKVLYRSFNTNKLSYLFGDDVFNYLRIEDNYNSSYCMIAQFSSTHTTKELRIKITPSFIIDNQTNQRNYFFRVATANITGNDFCNLAIEETLSNGSINLNFPSSTPAYYVGDVCSNCSDDLSSTEIKFYKYNNINNSLQEISNSDLKVNDLRIIIENFEQSEDNGTTGNSCSDTSCQSSGFNCCVNNQCVNHKALIKDPSEMTPSELAEFNLAQAQSAENPNWYLQYPNLYYICPSFIEEDNDDDDTDPISDAETLLQQKIQDYNCINELSTYSEVTPFHESPINSSHTYTSCSLSSSENNYYETVMHRLYENCGCDSSNITLTDKINNCPKYLYNPIYELDQLGNETSTIVNLSCTVAQEDDGDDGTIRIFEVSTKSAPHRYFNTDGVEIDLDKNPAATVNQTQEGSPFVYLDSDFIFPQNGSFNMNSILGQMYVNLDLAKPAKKIKVDFDKQYYIATLNGYYTPCPTCAKDSWYGQLSAHPNSGQGFGIQSIGFSTDRSNLGTNTSFANYEDNSFGRACFIPPTMLPFSQKAYSDSQVQRLNRLKTQAALFVNGYQKDWYGFNKGAMIGSFDGVTWFPIGNGRIVRSTSEYLYLAINAPYADLALTNNHTVSVGQWDGLTTAPRFDYDPTKTLNNPYQNQGGTCQENYLCDADKDCITKLGWEYTCQDVTSIKTSWPNFNTSTSDEISDSTTNGSLFEFLQQKQMPPGNNNKRCVYRGSGSICRTHIEEIENETLRRSLSCAPNFYCANVNFPGLFNKEIARFGAPLQSLIESNNHLYGKDANQLGRPKNYITIGNGTNLPIEVRNAISENVLLIDPTSINKAGLCLPGRALPNKDSGSAENYLPSDTQDQSDTKKRTDYISQIAGCNSALYDEIKYASCPLLDSDGNYETLKDSFNEASTLEKYSILLNSSKQNSCSLESLSSNAIVSVANTSDSLLNFSAFSSIEGKDISDPNVTITTPTLAVNACLRRAGSVCHTNLDCSPNSKHAEVIDIIDPDFFGNEAEKKYWSESLICAQGIREPNLGESNFNNYDITNNRCCREIGKSISVYTQEADNISMNVRKFASTNPKDTDRYSRYSILGELVNSHTPGLNDGEFVAPSSSINLTDDTHILTKYQWRTINETAKRTCCGGGFIRKFADGTNNWTINRLNLDLNNFACLNSKSPLTTIEGIEASLIDNNINYSNDLEIDRISYCSDPNRSTGGCVDHNFLPLDFNIDTKPSLNSETGTSFVYTYTPDDSDRWLDDNHNFTFFSPRSADSNPLTHLNWDLDFNSDSGQIRRNIRIKIPSYIPINLNNPAIDFTRTTNEAQTILSVRIGQNGTQTLCESRDWRSDLYGMSSPDRTPYWTTYNCMYTIDRLTREMYISYERNDIIENLDPTDTFNVPGNAYGNDNDVRYAQIEFIAPGTQAWEDLKASADPLVGGSSLTHRRSSSPGEPLYYLDKLANLELIGIPQITYEPLYCNNNYQKLVPGIFTENYKSILDVIDGTSDFFESSEHETPFSALTPAESASFDRAMVTTQESLSHSQIFSSNEMMCCVPLGKESSDASKCCSGFSAIDSNDQKSYCKIPKGVNLNVYFNKFVSNEGSNEESGSATLNESEYDPKTGFPILNSSVLQKLGQLGSDFCENGITRRGSAFGNFAPAPSGLGQSSGTTYYNIVDSYSDVGNNNATIQSASIFAEGYRWNQHVYCD